MTSRFEVDEDAVAQASLMLGLKHPVRVFVRRYEWGLGRYIAFIDGEHRIGIASDLSPRKASQVLWHEMTHAHQVERLGSKQNFDGVWRQQMHALGLTRKQAARATGRRYRRAPLEREAEQHERNHRRVSLTLPIGAGTRNAVGLRRSGAGAVSRCAETLTLRRRHGIGTLNR